MDFGLADKVVIVTGATANIGRAIALDFAAEGAKVVVVGRDEEAAGRLIELAGRRGAGTVVFVKEDMLDPSSAARILARAEELGPVEVLVNNVGSGASVGLFATTDQNHEGHCFSRSMSHRPAGPGGCALRYTANIGNTSPCSGKVFDEQFHQFLVLQGPA
jgi:NAD(P)-dependent dehydrogenase (short-subunit alcohol dehydrogenase family)